MYKLIPPKIETPLILKIYERNQAQILLILILLPMLGMEAIAQTNSNAIVGEWVNEGKEMPNSGIYRKGDKYFGEHHLGQQAGLLKMLENPDPKKRISRILVRAKLF